MCCYLSKYASNKATKKMPARMARTTARGSQNGDKTQSQLQLATSADQPVSLRTMNTMPRIENRGKVDFAVSVDFDKIVTFSLCGRT